MHRFIRKLLDLLKRKSATAGFIVIAVEQRHDSKSLTIEVLQYHATGLTYLGAIKESIDRLHRMKRENTTAQLRATFQELFLAAGED